MHKKKWILPAFKLIGMSAPKTRYVMEFPYINSVEDTITTENQLKQASETISETK